MRTTWRGACTLICAATIACGDATDPGIRTPVRGVAFFQPGMPAEWVGGSIIQNAFEIGIDQGILRSGSAAGYIRSISPGADQGFVVLSQSLSALGLRGRRVRMSAWLRADSLARLGGLYMRIDGATAVLGFDNMTNTNRAITGTRDWQEYSVVLDVPSSALGIAFGALMEGRGVLRIDDVKLEEVDASVPLTAPPVNTPNGADSATIVAQYARAALLPLNLDFEGVGDRISPARAWIAANAKPFTTDVPGSAQDDLTEFSRIVGSARVVALGEATHGTREFFRMKHRVFEYLVERIGFTHFTIEATMPEARVVDHYVTTGNGDPSKALAGLRFWTWNTDEVFELIQWMRAYNVRVGSPRLRFYGYDMQFVTWALDSIPAMISRADPALGLRTTNMLRCFAPARNPAGVHEPTWYGALTSTQHAACRDSVNAVADLVSTRRASWRASLSAEDLDWLAQYVVLVKQWEDMARRPAADGPAIRDRSMAQNLQWIAARHPAARLFSWAHNAHVSRNPGWMGAHMATAMGEDYRAFAFTFGQGRFIAVPRFNVGGPSEHVVAAPQPGTLEDLFQSSNMTQAILDTRLLASATSPPVMLFRRPVSMRSIGSVYSPTEAGAYFTPAILPNDYDAIIWFANTTASRLRPF